MSSIAKRRGRGARHAGDGGLSEAPGHDLAPADLPAARSQSIFCYDICSDILHIISIHFILKGKYYY